MATWISIMSERSVPHLQKGMRPYFVIVKKLIHKQHKAIRRLYFDVSVSEIQELQPLRHAGECQEGGQRGPAELLPGFR